MKELAALAALTIACGGASVTQAQPQPAAARDDSGSADAAADSDDAGPEDAADQLPSAGTVAVAAPSPHAALLAEANRQLDVHKVSHYVHHTHVDEARGLFDYDCSGFVGYALSRAAPLAFGKLVAATRPRPLAKDFEAFFASPPAGSTWTRVPLARDLVPGDIIAWLEPPAKHSRNTGHVMIVAAAATAGTRPNEVVVQIIDSSHSGHGKADARNRDHTSGIGTGKLILLTDDAGHPTGYRWSLSKISVAYATTVALGRLP